MAITSLGKKWEEKFKKTWAEQFPNNFLYRLPDQQSMYKGYSSNPCDFFAMMPSELLLIECKEHKGNTFPFSAFRQYDTMVSVSKYKSLVCGLLIWFSEHGKVVWCPIEEVQRIKEELGAKSINVKMIGDPNYKLIEVPCRIPRTFPECDFKYLVSKICLPW